MFSWKIVFTLDFLLFCFVYKLTSCSAEGLVENYVKGFKKINNYGWDFLLVLLNMKHTMKIQKNCKQFFINCRFKIIQHIRKIFLVNFFYQNNIGKKQYLIYCTTHKNYILMTKWLIIKSVESLSNLMYKFKWFLLVSLIKHRKTQLIINVLWANCLQLRYFSFLSNWK